MSSKILPFAIACLAMVPYALGVTSVAPTPCSGLCNTGTLMTICINATISDCTSALELVAVINIDWIIELVLTVHGLCLTLLIVSCVTAVLTGLLGTIIATILYLLLLLLCGLIEILMLLAGGDLTPAECLTLCNTWYTTAQAALWAYPSTTIQEGLLIHICLVICSRAMTLITAALGPPVG